jgi:hypothetical protein
VDWIFSLIDALISMRDLNIFFSSEIGLDQADNNSYTLTKKSHPFAGSSKNCTSSYVHCTWQARSNTQYQAVGPSNASGSTIGARQARQSHATFKYLASKDKQPKATTTKQNHS